MQEHYGDLWDMDVDVRCILTNTHVHAGKNPMGGGVAAEAAKKFPWLPSYYGKLLQDANRDDAMVNGVFLIPPRLVMFPTIDSLGAHLARILVSLLDTQALATIYEWKTIALPRPGVGIGGLSWEKEVKPFLERVLKNDNRFIIVHKEAS